MFKVVGYSRRVVVGRKISGATFEKPRTPESRIPVSASSERPRCV